MRLVVELCDDYGDEVLSVEDSCSTLEEAWDFIKNKANEHRSEGLTIHAVIHGKI